MEFTRQYLYRGRRTSKSQLLDMILADDVNYSNEEIALMIGCKPSTVAAYLREWDRHREHASLMTTPYEIPVETRVGRKLIHYYDPTRNDCNGCPLLAICTRMVRQGDFIACEVPLEKEMLNWDGGYDDE